MKRWKDYQTIQIGLLLTIGLIGLCSGTVPDCAHQLNGVMYPNTLDCSTFWVCEYERPTLVQCDPGLLYDPQLRVCNWWYAVTCGETPVGTSTESPSSTISTTISVTTTADTPITTIESTTPAVDTTTTSEPSTTTIENITTTVESTTNDDTTTSTEPARTITEETTTTTEPTTTTTEPVTTPTGTDPITESSPNYPDCANSNGQIYYPHLTDSSKYYICAGTFPIELVCPAKFVWAQEYLSCISTEMPEESCSNNEYSPHPDDEQYYYQCIDGKPILSACPSNLKWNQVLLKCTEEAPVMPAYPDCNNTNGQIYFPHPVDITKYYFCAGHFPVELPCPTKFKWYQVYERCIGTDLPESEEELIDCALEKYASHPNDDQMYYECVDEKPIIAVCPSDLKWNQELLDCIHEIPIEAHYPECNNPTGQIYFPHLTDPSKYYICAGDLAIELSCPVTFLWYQEYQSCARNDLTEEEKEIIDCKLHETAYIPHPNDEQLYYRCIDETPVQLICPGNSRWNHELLKCTNALPDTVYPQCDNPTGQIYFPHLTDSSKYYICAGDFAIELSCPSGFLWAQDYQSCAKIPTSEEDTDIIDCASETSGTQSAPHEENNQFYYLCIAEKPVLMLCTLDLIWDNTLKKCTEEVTPEPEYPQCNNPTGEIYFPHLTDPSKYYICAGVFPVELPCPAGFLWNQNYQSCVRTEIPEDEEEILECDSATDTQFAPHPEDKQLYYHCVDNKPVLMLCPSDLKWNQELLKCTDELPAPVYPECNNPTGQIYFPHLTDSSKYYICAGDFAIELSCPFGFLWAQDYQSCAKIPTSEEDTDIIDCASETSGTQSAPHEENDQFYYLCIAEKPVLLLCPSDLKWDIVLEKCTNEVTADPKYPKCDNPEGQIYFPHLTDASKYYICAGDLAIELSCPSEFLWSQDYQSCARTETPDDEEDIIDCSIENGPQTMPHLDNDQFYYLCIVERPVLMLCPSDLKWDTILQKCSDEVTPEPTYPQCENPTGQIYFPHLTNTSKYYICAGDLPIELLCPVGFLWSQDHQSCSRTETPEDEDDIIDCAIQTGPQSAPYDDDDQLYYLCIAEKPILMLCPSDLKWDQIKQICTDDVTVQPEYPQCDNPSGQVYFPHLTDSTKYYICAGDLSIELPCPAGFFWSQDHQSCARSETPDDEEDVLDCLLESGPQSAPHKENNQFYYLCIAKRPVLLICPADLKWDQNLKMCTEEGTTTPEYPQCENESGQIYFAHLTDSSKYFICAGTIPIELSCPSSFVWSQDYQSCLSSEMPSEEIPLECVNPDAQQHISHPTDPQKYFVCLERHPALMHCPYNATWNNDLGKCLFEPIVEPNYPPCGNGQIFFPHLTDSKQYYLCSGDFGLLMTCPNEYIWSTEATSCVEERPASVEPDCSKANGNLPHPTDPKKYYICLGESALEMECPGDTLWNSELASCAAQVLYPDCTSGQMLFPHLTEVDKYYMCIGGEPYLMVCTKDYIWDTEVNSCVSIKQSTTTESTTTTTEAPAPVCTETGIFIPHPTDLEKYFACVGSPPIPIELKCMGNTFWISSFQRCAAPDITNLPSLPSVGLPTPDCSNGEEFLTNYLDCHKYYICIGGVLPMEFTCEKDTYWDPIDSRCSEERTNCFLK